MSDAVSVSEAVEQLARRALAEITKPHTVGARLAVEDEGDHVVSIHFDAIMPGYSGWRWTVSVAQLPDAEPTVLETELTPGDTALLAPEWVPWADRLAEYRAAQEAAEHEAGESDDDESAEVDDELDEEDLDDEDDEELDGVDVDQLEDSDDADSDDEDDEDSDDEDDEDSDEDDDSDEEDDSDDEDDDSDDDSDEDDDSDDEDDDRR
ncbi:DUF3027 domain-containing protein [Herbiconiux sp. SYSU D00978]|uniref:DUF3027 domain-containing protein n=1 Tax=Herbiconiux sp. SYSU D00978 TaxID=2812562 RepID=UPI001A97C32B|nr:DUF3027 domain-containing protein [Herbiconiux sp. SYSU D00978]